MDLQQLANIGEFVGAIAVIATLLFLAVQVRQNSSVIAENMKLVRAQSKQMSTIQYSEFTRTLIESTETAMLFQRANLSNNLAEDLSETEQRIFHGLMARAMFLFNDDHYRYKLGLTDEEEWQDNLNLLRSSYIRRPGFRHWWMYGTAPGQAGEDLFGSRFVTFINQEIAYEAQSSAEA